MVKDHCNIEVFFKEYDMFYGTDGNFPFKIVVRSNTCGINALTGEPVKGTFYYEPKESPGGTFKFTVPRQFDRSLVIEVYNTEEYHGNTDHVATFNVWNWAHAMEDFSWKDKNLADLSIVIEMASGRYEFPSSPGGAQVADMCMIFNERAFYVQETHYYFFPGGGRLHAGFVRKGRDSP